MNSAQDDSLKPDDEGGAQSGRGSISDIVERVQRTGAGGDPKVSDIVDALGGASFGPLMLVPALLIASPLSAIPVLPTFAGIAITLIAAQMVFGRDHVWLPDWIMRRQISRPRFDRALDFLKKPARFVDHIARPRLRILTAGPFLLALQTMCLVGGLIMPVLEFIPFSSSVVGASVAFLSVAIITRDGLLALIGIAFVAGGTYLMLNLFGFL